MIIHPTDLTLRALFAGDLPDVEADSVSGHLDLCPACRDAAERITEVPRDVWASLVVAGDRASAPECAAAPAVRGFEALRELGRGGCGVVYRATETATGRVVALKVLRSGPMASPAELARFRTEARAAANLRHPNVVTVLAVGDQGDLPYYAMEYLPAGSLADRLDATPLPAVEAAALMEAVARGVQHAHDRGLIHRDLKPGNVLLDGPAAGVGLAVPKVADFGMAKLAEAALGATPTQAILGTPGYMAPEQAFGLSRGVGKPADVYALGAILYELITGRPPFRGSTPYETLLLARDAEPVPARRLRPGLPADLDTIASRCLEKDPARRYPDAGGLADDLRAFLDGRPVAARPVGRTGRLIRWARRDPAVATLSGVSLGLLVAGLLGATFLWRRAEARQAMAVKGLRLYTQVANKVFRDPWLVSPEDRESLLRALALHENLLDHAAGGDPAEADRVAYETLQLADALHTQGRSDHAARLGLRAVNTLRALADADPAAPDVRHHYADGCSQLGGTLSALGRSDEALLYREEAERQGVALVDANPGRDAYLTSLASYRAALALEYKERGRPVEADALLRFAVEAHRALIGRHPEDPARYEYYGFASRVYGDFLLRTDPAARGYADQARGRLELAEANLRAPGRHAIAWALVRPEVAWPLVHAGREVEAEALLARGLAAWSALADEEPAVAPSRFRLALTLGADGDRLWAPDPASAHDRYRRAEAALEALRGGAWGAAATYALAELLAICPDPEVRDPARAAALMDAAPPGPEPVGHFRGLARLEAGDFAGARDSLRGFLAGTKLPPSDNRVRIARIALAGALSALGDREGPLLIAALRREVEADPTAGPSLLAMLGRAGAPSPRRSR